MSVVFGEDLPLFGPSHAILVDMAMEKTEINVGWASECGMRAPKKAPLHFNRKQIAQFVDGVANFGPKSPCAPVQDKTARNIHPKAERGRRNSDVAEFEGALFENVPEAVHPA